MIDFLIDLVRSQKRFMGAHAVDLSAVQHEDQIRVLNGGNALGNDEFRRLRDLGAQGRADLRVGLRVASCR